MFKATMPYHTFLYQTNVNTISSTARFVHDYSMYVTLRKNTSLSFICSGLLKATDPE